MSFYGIDATSDNPKSYGRFIKQDKRGNLKSTIFTVNERPYIVFFAKRDISACEELTFNYGDRNVTYQSTEKELDKILKGIFLTNYTKLVLI